MFEGFARVWTPVLLSRDLGARPKPLRLAGTPVVLFRDEEGRARALIDRCPHRGVALSLGRVVDGCLECPFHGWRFDGDGAVRHVPWNPDAKVRRGATSLPVHEEGQIVWLYTGPATSPPHSPPDIPAVFKRADVHVSVQDITFATHWSRAMENMLDWPHLPFVHRRTIGKQMVGREGKRMDIRLEERAHGFHSTIAIDGVEQPGSLAWYFPNCMVLTIPVPGKTLVMLNACLPVDDRTTRMLVFTARDFLKLRVLDPVFRRQNRSILEEDCEVVGTSFPSEVPEASAESSTRTDAPTLYFRKRYLAELRGRAVELSLHRPEPAA